MENIWIFRCFLRGRRGLKSLMCFEAVSVLCCTLHYVSERDTVHCLPLSVSGLGLILMLCWQTWSPIHCQWSSSRTWHHTQTLGCLKSCFVQRWCTTNLKHQMHMLLQKNSLTLTLITGAFSLGPRVRIVLDDLNKHQDQRMHRSRVITCYCIRGCLLTYHHHNPAVSADQTKWGSCRLKPIAGQTLMPCKRQWSRVIR